MNASSCQMLVAGVAVALLLNGCSIDVHKGDHGEDKRVKIDTPLGNIHVNSDQPDGNTGMALYPGAQSRPDHDGDKNADVQLGFGAWQLRVKVEHYSSDDPESKVLAYYRHSMAQFGDVLECRGNSPVGTPVRTSQGLTCSDQDGKQQVHHDFGQELSLRTGSKRHQHIVAFDKNAQPDKGPTRFSLIALDLPQDSKKDVDTD